MTSNSNPDFETPPSDSLFSPSASSSSSLGTSPAISNRSSFPSPTPKRKTSTTLFSHQEEEEEAEEDEAEETFEDATTGPPKAGFSTFAQYKAPEAISMNENIIYNENTLKYMKIIGRYQELLGREIELPRLVIAGAQSSGKSSLLENLTGLPVPITPGIGTRFPIEITLIEDPVYSVTATIVPDPQAKRTLKPEGRRVLDFKRSFTGSLTVVQFENLLKDASDVLRLPKPVFAEDQISGVGIRPASSSISRHTLRIEMKGPQFKNLSLVDTPGLYSAGNSEQDSNSAPEIEKLVLSLISEKRTIVIAVMDGRELTALQPLLGSNFLQKVDEGGQRTIGVLTKCDNLPLNQKHDIQRAINRAANKELRLSHGWYVIKNRSSSEAEAGLSIDAARNLERTLFSEPPWSPSVSGLSPSRMGIDALRLGLSNLFCSHIRNEFPSFNKQARQVLADKRAELRALGPARSSQGEQRAYLLSLVAAYQEPKLMCLHDNRRHVNPHDPTIVDRYLAVVKKIELRDALDKKGCVWEFQSASTEVDLVADVAANAILKVDGKEGEESIYTWINSRFQASKACEVPGLVPYPLVERLFEEQTENWVSITTTFTEKVKSVLQEAVKHCLKIACSNARVLEALEELVQEKIAAKMSEFLKGCLELIDQHRAGMQIVANEAWYVSELNTARTQRFISAVARLRKSPVVGAEPPAMAGFDDLRNFMVLNGVALMEVLTNERQTVYQIHDILKAYYALSISHYTETVCKNLLNGSFVAEVMDVFSAELIEVISEGEVDALVGESVLDREIRRGLVEDIAKYEMAIREAEDILRERVEV